MSNAQTSYYQVYQDQSQQRLWRWRLRAMNHHIIADSSEGYYNKADCLAAIAIVKASYNSPVYDA